MLGFNGNAARAAFAAALVGMSLGACTKGTPELQSGPVSQTYPTGVSAADFSYTAPDSPEYRVRAGDVLSINVRGEPNLSLETVRVSSDGTFMAPGVGRVIAADRTPLQISSAIEDTLRRTYLRDPNVAVNVAESQAQFVTVEGAVEQPGMFPFTQRTTLLGAVAMAKGPDDSARLDQVVIFREIDGEPMAARFDLNMIRSGQMSDPVILPGDRVVIAQRGSNAFEEVLNAVPLLFLFTRI